MMKIFKKGYQLLCIVLIFSSCGVSINVSGVASNQKKYYEKNTSVIEKGNTITTIRFSGNSFDKIKVSGGLKVFLTQSDSTLVQVIADKNVQDVIKTEIEGGVLRVYPSASIRKKAVKRIIIHVVDINSIQTTSGVLLKAENTLQIKALTVITTSGSDVRLLLRGNEVVSKSTSGSSISLEGTINTINAVSTSGSSIDASKLKSSKCFVKATSGSSITVNCNQKMEAKVTSGASVNYSGNPINVSITKKSGGSIYK